MTNHRKRLSRQGRIWLFIAPAILLTLAIGGLIIWRVMLFFNPPDHYSGADLYNSGKYLQYADGKLFQQSLEELPLPETAEVVSFDYYDFWNRDNYLQADPAADLYMVHFVLQESPDALESYLIENGYSASKCKHGKDVTIYVKSPKGDKTAFFSVIIPHSSQDVYCTLVVDGGTAYRDIELFYRRNIGTAPWE